MTDKNNDHKKEEKKSDSVLKPDKETLNTTDPQEKMEGPISSLIQGIKETGEDNNEETKEEADKKKDKNT